MRVHLPFHAQLTSHLCLLFDLLIFYPTVINLLTSWQAPITSPAVVIVPDADMDSNGSCLWFLGDE